MGGDHKCPVCQATFTRPQHVARHMRSHTGDRPYKCQHCGDQFARSDLLSRHINKCHANEKFLPNSGAPRRKGSASLARATTSKQACDQCVQSTLPCDGCNPCSKCVQRKCRCTYVKFHRQTLPSGPGHDHRQSSTAGRPHTSPDNFLLAGPSLTIPPMSSDDTYTQTFTFPHIYPPDTTSSYSMSPTDSIESDYATKYRAHADLLRRTGSLPNLAPALYSDAHPESAWLGWAQDDPYAAVNHPLLRLPAPGDDDRDMRLEGNTEPTMARHFLEEQHVVHGNARASHDAYACGPQHSNVVVQSRDRRGSMDFSSGDSSGSQSLPSSGPSSTAHLPLSEVQQRQGSYHDMHGIASNHSATSSTNYTSGTHAHPGMPQQQHIRNSSHGDGGFSSVFGLMSLDDPNVAAGLATDGAPFFSNEAMSMQSDDPDITPMLPKHNPSRRGNESYTLTSSREAETRELKDFWKAYMRTPLSGPGSAMDIFGQRSNNSATLTPHTRRPRVASLPSVKTPPAFGDQAHRPAVGPGNQEANNVTSSIRTTLQGNHDDLRSYEAAVLARKTITNLNLIPRKQRGGLTSPNALQAPAPRASAGASIARPPFVVAFGHPSSEQARHCSGALSDESRTNLGYPAHSSTSSRGSSVPTGGEDSSDKDLRPSFKRLPSQTLVPANAKKALLSHHITYEDEGEDIDHGHEGVLREIEDGTINAFSDQRTDVAEPAATRAHRVGSAVR